MKQVGGVWLPDGETHMGEIMLGDKARYVDGLATYQYKKLERALQLAPADRRRRCIDIGAHCGTWSMWLVAHFAQVEAFEPVAVHRECYAANVDPRGANWKLHPVALGAAPDRIAMREVGWSTGSAHVWGKGEIEMRTLDSFGFDEVDFIKIDVEGLEFEVCQGAAATIRTHRPVMVVEQKGREQKTYGKKQRDLAVAWLERELGMKRLAEISGDWILGW